VDAPTRAGWRARIRLGSLGYAVAVVASAAAAVRGGIWERFGAIIEPPATLVIDLLLLVLQVILRPIFWLVERVHLNPQAARDLLQRLRRNATRPIHFAPGRGGVGPLIGRLVGLAAVLAIAWITFRVLRRLRPPAERDEETDPARLGTIDHAPIPDEDPGTTGRRRRELPADAVRRWYAEVLLALDRRELSKEPSATPAEFLALIRGSHPAIGDDLEQLTRAYEDVRYGALHLDDASLRDLDARHRALLRELRRMPGPSDPDGPVI
jgi:hypothetical protein